jgi:hypothetical protein
MTDITVYAFEDGEGTEDDFTTFNYDEARDHAMKHKLKLIARTYEYSDSELVWDYTEKSGIDWEDIRADLDLQRWEDDPTNPGTQTRRAFLGTVFDLYPSGKYHTASASSNVTEEEAEADQDFAEMLDREADEHGLYVESGEGDPCDLFAVESRDIPESNAQEA